MQTFFHHSLSCAGGFTQVPEKVIPIPTPTPKIVAYLTAGLFMKEPYD